MTKKISIYQVNELTEILDSAGVIVDTTVTPLDTPVLITSVFVNTVEETTRMVTITNEDGTSSQKEETYTPEFDPSKYYPKYNGKTMAYGEYGIEYPIYDNTNNVIREKTRIEKINDGNDSLLDGEIIKDGSIVTVLASTEFLKPSWDGTEWIESATEQDIADHITSIKTAYFSLVDQYKKIIMDTGIVWNGHKQKLRVDIDIPLITGAILSLERKIANGEEDPIKIWSFNNMDNNVILRLADFNEILIAADNLVDKCYQVERNLKLEEPNLQLTLSDFSDAVLSL